jgi:hypothetical protein
MKHNSSKRKGIARVGVSFVLAFVIAFGAASFLLAHQNASAQSCQITNTEFCTPFGVGNNNYSMFPNLNANGNVATLLSTQVQIMQTLSQPANQPTTQPGSEVGCPALDYAAFTYQNNFEVTNGNSFYQEVLTVGWNNAPAGGTTGSCFTIEYSPIGAGGETYDYYSVGLPIKYTPIFYQAGNTLGFIVNGVDTTPGFANITSFVLTLNGQTLGVITPSEIQQGSCIESCVSPDPSPTTPPIYQGCTTSGSTECTNGYNGGYGTENNFDIVGSGNGNPGGFSSGGGSINYCGLFPATGLGGFVGYGGGTLESSSFIYGNVTASNGGCYSQSFSYNPGSAVVSSSTTMSSSTSSSSTITSACNLGSSSSGVTITSPGCSKTISGSSLSLQGSDSLPPGNYAIGAPGQALGFPCYDGEQPNVPGCPSEPQLNLLKAWIDSYSSTSFLVHLTASDLSSLTTVAAPAEGQYWAVQWTYHGTEYFVMMTEWLTNAASASTGSGPFQSTGISYWYGIVTDQNIEVLIYSNYNFVGQIGGSYSAAAPGEITFTVPVSDVGNPSSGASFQQLSAETGQIAGTYNSNTQNYTGLQIISTPDFIYAPDSYSLGSAQLPDGYVQIAILPVGQSPSASTTWTNAGQVNYPAENDWQATVSLNGLKAGTTYVIYVTQFQTSSGAQGPFTETTFVYS